MSAAEAEFENLMRQDTSLDRRLQPRRRAQLVFDQRRGYGWLFPPGTSLSAAVAATYPAVGVQPIRQPLSRVGQVSLGEAENGIIEQDDRVYVRNTQQAPFRFVCKLMTYYILEPDNLIASFHASGVLIGNRHVLTAAHVLYDYIPLVGRFTMLPAYPRLVVVTPGQNGSRQRFGLYITANQFRVPVEWSRHRDEQADFGLITFMDPIGALPQPALGHRPLGFWSSPQNGFGTHITPVAVNELRQRRVRTSGYPGDKCGVNPPRGSGTEAQLDSCEPALFASTQWTGVGYIRQPVVPTAPSLMNFTLDTAKGQSGSPVWLQDARGLNLISLFISPSPSNEAFVSNRGVRITDQVVHQLRYWMGKDHVVPTF